MGRRWRPDAGLRLSWRRRNLLQRLLPERNEMAELPKRALGRTGLQVTMLGYGAMELRGAPRGRDVTDKQAEIILHAVLDAGINYLDTSIDYGLSAERTGRNLGDWRPEHDLPRTS